jgi:hypothetical protein
MATTLRPAAHMVTPAASRGELEEWVRRFDAAGVSYTPIRDMPFGHHLNFRDPDNIPLEFYVPNDTVLQGYEELRTRGVSREKVHARAAGSRSPILRKERLHSNVPHDLRTTPCGNRRLNGQCCRLGAVM